MSEGVVAILIVVFGVFFAVFSGGEASDTTREAVQYGDEAKNEMNKQMEILNELDITKFHGEEVYGSSVINAIKDFEADDTVVNVVVNNGKGETTYCYESDLTTKVESNVSGSFTKMKYNDKSNLSTYINPTSKFVGAVIRDEDTNTIITLRFEKIS